MDLAQVEPIVNAVLYEGYMLYPYRPSSVKNRQRWTFGGVYPQAYSLAQPGADTWIVQTECLAIASGRPEALRVDLKLRFLHLLAREVGKLAAPSPDLPAGVEPYYYAVEQLRAGEALFQSWQEVVERDVDRQGMALSDLLAGPLRLAFAFPASREFEPVREPGGEIVGVIVRRQQPIEGQVELAAECAGERVFKLTVQVQNLSPLEATRPSRDEAQLSSFASTHLILGLSGGEFVSLLDPPEPLRGAAAGCRNSGLWPVLVGDQSRRDMLLASPIILYDYPQVAPESPGDLFDATEIDEILTLRIMTMTEDEKREMGAADERARLLLERTEALAREQLLGLHGTMRGLRSLEQGS